MEEENKEKENVEIPKGFYLTEVPTNYSRVLAKGDKQVNADELLVKMANALEEAGILKE